MKAYDEMRAAAQKQYQTLLADLAQYYSDWIMQVETSCQELLKTTVDYYTAGYTIGTELARGLLDSIDIIEAAAQAAAQTIEDNLALSSPAREGPLSRIHTWWREFAQTLLQGWQATDWRTVFDQHLDEVMDIWSWLPPQGALGLPGPAKEPAFEERIPPRADHLYVHLDGNATGMDLDDLADKLSRRLSDRVTVAAYRR